MRTPKPVQLSSGSWRTQITLGGERISITKPTRDEVLSEVNRLHVLYEEGLKPSRIVSTKLGVAIDNYIDSRSNVLSESTIRAYRAYRRTRFVSYMDKPVGTIDWQRMVNSEAKLVRPKTLKNAWGLVRASLAEIGINETVRLPAQEPTEKLWLTPEQIPIFLNTVRGKPVETGALLALHGLRRSEIYGLEWSDIDGSCSMLHIHQSMVMDDHAKLVVRNKNKTTASTRDVPVFIPRLQELLLAEPNKSGRVVTGNIGTLRERIASACKEAGLPDIGVHGLRHSMCSLCYSKGISELACMRLGGWSDYQTMRKIYTHLSEADAKSSTDILMEYFSKNSQTLTKNLNNL